MKFERWGAAARSISLFVAVLAIANIESIWQDYHQSKLQERRDFLAPRPVRTPGKLASASAQVRGEQPLQAALRSSIEEVELNDDNPFAHLSTLEPLQFVLNKGVTGFQRETYRSPDYSGEDGYDLVSYQVTHPDGAKSTIMAYLERVDSRSSVRIPFVIFMAADGEAGNRYFFFRGANLVQNSELSPEEAQSLISRRLSQSIPFLSVSR